MRLRGLATMLVVLAACRGDGPGPARPIRVGHVPSPLLGALYAAEPPPGLPWERVRFGSGGEVGYALLAGELDAGFVETAKALALLGAPGGEALGIAAAVEFPYGATLVVHRDLAVRLADLPGLRIAASEPGCKLLHQLEADARRHGVDFGKVRIAHVPFPEMLPALEARAVDGAVLRSAYAVVAELEGHKVLYQNWEMRPGDDCCPQALGQVEAFLVVRRDAAARAAPVVEALLAAGELPPARARDAVSRHLGYPLAALESLPVASLAPLSEDARRQLGRKVLSP